jgi:hypothetical protein
MAMSEAEWLACKDPRAMLEFLRRKASDRKLRLFAVACCRRIWHVMSDERIRAAVEVAERFADGQANAEELKNVTRAADKVDELASPPALSTAACAAYYLGGKERSWCSDVTHCAAYAAASSHADWKRQPSDYDATLNRERTAQAGLLRCVFGPYPSRPVTINPAWRTANVSALAQTIYDERAFDRLPILADALEDAGCDNADILNHCRQPGEHCRGCWVVDLVLDKE